MGLTDDKFLPNSEVDEAAKRFAILGDCGLIAPVIGENVESFHHHNNDIKIIVSNRMIKSDKKLTFKC